jgi:NAD(P)-dependent dehydrogenase (short-subunit alcohol dehydrogenase family)
LLLPDHHQESEGHWQKNLHDKMPVLRLPPEPLCNWTNLKSEFPGVEILTVQTDVSKEEDCNHLIQSVIEKYGRIDVLINNAGISMRALFENTELFCVKEADGCELLGGSLLFKVCLALFVKVPGQFGRSLLHSRL